MCYFDQVSGCLKREKHFCGRKNRETSHSLLEGKVSLYVLYISGPFGNIIPGIVFVFFYKRMKRKLEYGIKIIIKKSRIR